MVFRSLRYFAFELYIDSTAPPAPVSQELKGYLLWPQAQRQFNFVLVQGWPVRQF